MERAYRPKMASYAPDDSLSTLICEVESITNSRPITVVSSDANDLDPLTPNH